MDGTTTDLVYMQQVKPSLVFDGDGSIAFHELEVDELRVFVEAVPCEDCGAECDPAIQGLIQVIEAGPSLLRACKALHAAIMEAEAKATPDLINAVEQAENAMADCADATCA